MLIVIAQRAAVILGGPATQQSGPRGGGWCHQDGGDGAVGSAAEGGGTVESQGLAPGGPSVAVSSGETPTPARAAGPSSSGECVWYFSCSSTSDVLEHKWRASLKLHYC